MVREAIDRIEEGEGAVDEAGPGAVSRW
jgi:hypothetical protein